MEEESLNNCISNSSDNSSDSDFTTPTKNSTKHSKQKLGQYAPDRNAKPKASFTFVQSAVAKKINFDDFDIGNRIAVIRKPIQKSIQKTAKQCCHHFVKSKQNLWKIKSLNKSKAISILKNKLTLAKSKIGALSALRLKSEMQNDYINRLESDKANLQRDYDNLDEWCEMVQSGSRKESSTLYRQIDKLKETNELLQDQIIRLNENKQFMETQTEDYLLRIEELQRKVKVLSDSKEASLLITELANKISEKVLDNIENKLSW